jgi:hypothetical protein
MTIPPDAVDDLLVISSTPDDHFHACWNTPQLREMRDDAGLSGLAFARLAGWRDSSKVFKIEKGVRPASAADVRVWCRLCGASVQRTEELLAEQRAAAGMWVTYKQLNRGGLKKAQESVRALYERVRVMRVYQTRVIPGLLQTEGYTTAALTAVRLKQVVTVDDATRDIAEAVAERMRRQQVLHRPDHSAAGPSTLPPSGSRRS